MRSQVWQHCIKKKRKMTRPSRVLEGRWDQQSCQVDDFSAKFGFFSRILLLLAGKNHLADFGRILNNLAENANIRPIFKKLLKVKFLCQTWKFWNKFILIQTCRSLLNTLFWQVKTSQNGFLNPRLMKKSEKITISVVNKAYFYLADFWPIFLSDLAGRPRKNLATLFLCLLFCHFFRFFNKF